MVTSTKQRSLLISWSCYTSCERSPTCSQILIILTKLTTTHFTAGEADTKFTGALKENVLGDLEKWYQIFSISIQSMYLQKGSKLHYFHCDTRNNNWSCFHYKVKTFRTSSRRPNWALLLPMILWVQLAAYQENRWFMLILVSDV